MKKCKKLYITFALFICGVLQINAQKIGLQMYSVRDLLSDYEQTGNKAVIDSIASMGYDFVEVYGYADGLFHGHEPVVFRNDIEDSGMTISSSHFSIQLTADELETGDYSDSLAKWDNAIAAHKAAGIKNMLMAWIQDPPTTVEGWLVYSSYLNAIGRKCKEAGMTFGYHNHWFEFDKVENNFPYDILLSSTNPEYVTFELDTYWMVSKGEDPVKWMERYPGRFKFVHLKDKTYLGSDNVVDCKAIMSKCDKAGTEYTIIEVEWYGETPILEAIRLSIDNLKNLQQ